MHKIRVAIVGYGNIGKHALEAVQATKDMEIAGIVRRNASISSTPSELKDIKVVDNISSLDKVDVAIICSPSRIVKEVASEILKKGINTVDSFDIHGDEMLSLRKELSEIGKNHNSKSIISAGWDPGSDSLIRTIFKAMAPKGITYTNFGPGMSMGHSVAVKNIDGVKDALSMTIPTGTGVHRRMVYIEIEENANFDEIASKIKSDSYFINDETHVRLVDSIEEIKDVGHGVLIERKGVSGKTQNQIFSYEMRINNPALTSQVLVSCARAVVKQQPGAYTMLEIPPIDYLEGDKDKLLKELV